MTLEKQQSCMKRIEENDQKQEHRKVQKELTKAFDMKSKKLFACPSILAWLLKDTISDLNAYTVEEIRDSIIECNGGFIPGMAYSRI